ncbi:hypothetical protein HDU76_001071 [Blyttiomyces sp. JEL0837]|nr:hypothetical protein HDU76_001071 [Blyttiomyces sp. JEL0837]
MVSLTAKKSAVAAGGKTAGKPTSAKNQQTTTTATTTKQSKTIQKQNQTKSSSQQQQKTKPKGGKKAANNEDERLAKASREAEDFLNSLDLNDEDNEEDDIEDTMVEDVIEANEDDDNVHQDEPYNTNEDDGQNVDAHMDLPDEIMELVLSDSAEFQARLDELVVKVGEAKEKIKSLLERVHNNELPTTKGVSLLELKLHSFLSYMTHLTFVILLKVNGKTIQSHPSITRLIELRIILEKVKPLEAKLKYQIDKLVKAANDAKHGGTANLILPGSSSTSASRANQSALSGAPTNALAFKPNPMGFVTTGGGDNDEEESKTKKSANPGDEETDGIYRPPRIAPMRFSETEKVKRKAGSLSDSAREASSRSRIMRDLRDAFDTRPEEFSADGTGYSVKDRRDRMDATLEAIEEAELENYTRYSKTKDRNKREKAMRRKGGVVSVQNEVEELEKDFLDLRGVDRAVQEDELERFGQGILGKRNRRSDERFAGSGKKRGRFEDAGELVSAIGKRTGARKNTSFEKDVRKATKKRWTAEEKKAAK